MRRKRYTDEEILGALRENPDLGIREWVEKKIKPSHTTIIDRFGSWNKAREAAGLKHLEGSTNKEKMLGLLKEKRIVSSKELTEKGIPTHLKNFRELVQEGVEVYRIDLRIRGVRGSTKYSKSKLLRSDAPDIIYSISLRYLSEYLKNIFRFDLAQDLEPAKKAVLTHYLKGRVPEEVVRDLKSLYEKSRDELMEKRYSDKEILER